MKKVTLKTWLDDPVAVVENIFSDNGPLATLMPGYVPNPIQVEYASILAQAAVRGVDPVKRGYVTPVQAGTGVGKSIAILVVAGINAVLREKRALVTTFTRALNRQMNGKDRDVAIAVVEAVTGIAPRISLRRPRSAFASPSRCRDQATLYAAESANEPEEVAKALMTLSDVLRRLADWTENENEIIVDEPFHGLIETYLEEHPNDAKPLSEIPFDLYTLEYDSPASEQGWYRKYAEEANQADVLIATHAALIRDQSAFGSVLDREGTGYSMVIMDEAHRIEQAGTLALGTKRALSSFRREAELLMPIAAALPPGPNRDALSDLALSQSELGTAMLEDLSAIANRAVMGRDREVGVAPKDKWIEKLRTLQAGTAKTVSLLDKVPGERARAAASRITSRQIDVHIFLDTIDRIVGQAGLVKGTPVPNHLKVFSDPMLSFSPRVAEPSIYVRPRFGARVVARLWNGGQDPRADAVVVTSATMGAPLPHGGTSFNSLLSSIGISPSEGRYHRDLARSLEAKDLGKMEELILAHPEAPLPSRAAAIRDDGESHRNPAWLDYATAAITQANNDVWHPQGKNRVVVLCTGFEESAIFAERLKGAGIKDVLLRRPDDHVDLGFQMLSGLEKGVLFTTGAFDGIDKPGLMQHLIIPRLPFTPDFRAFGLRDVGGGISMRRIDEETVMTLMQAIGRAFRIRSDTAKVWILDPRVGVPDALEMIPNPAANPFFLNAVPPRFHHMLETARLFEVENV